jgi:acyl-coenzyme A thioesterase PaaI-like protein
VHGGVLLTFADYVIYRAIGDERGHQQQFATINLNTQFLAAAKQSQIIYGDGRVVRNTRSVIFAEGRLWTDERKVMTATGIWKIIGA